jgi:hypothetical protein
VQPLLSAQRGRQRAAFDAGPAASHHSAAPKLAPVLIGAHGGTGVSTIHALLQPAWDLGSINPADRRNRSASLQVHGRPVVLVARNTVPSSAATTEAFQAIANTGHNITVLVIVDDGAGREPTEATARYRLLEGRLAGGMVRMPFVGAFRHVDDPTIVDLPKGAARALAQIRELCGLAVRP